MNKLLTAAVVMFVCFQLVACGGGSGSSHNDNGQSDNRRKEVLGSWKSQCEEFRRYDLFHFYGEQRAIYAAITMTFSESEFQEIQIVYEDPGCVVQSEAFTSANSANLITRSGSLTVNMSSNDIPYFDLSLEFSGYGDPTGEKTGSVSVISYDSIQYAFTGTSTTPTGIKVQEIRFQALDTNANVLAESSRQIYLDGSRLYFSEREVTAETSTEGAVIAVGEGDINVEHYFELIN